MSFILTIIAVLIVFDVFWWWRADRWLRPLPRSVYWRVALSAFMALQFGCLAWIIAGRFFGTDRPDELIPRWLTSLVFIWHMIVLPPSIAIWLVAAFIGAPAHIWKRLHREKTKLETETPTAPAFTPRKPSASPAVPTLVRTAGGTRYIPRTAEEIGVESAPIPREPMTRRQLLGAAVALTPPIITAVTTGIAATQLDQFRVRRMDIALAALPPALDGLTIAHVTDIHVGRFTGGATLDAIVAQTNALKADLVLLTGDLINHALSDLDVALAIVKQMDRRIALAMCEGNHDLFEGRWEFERRVKNAGVTLLINESTTFTVRGQRVQLMGLQWGRGGASARGPGERGDEAIAFSMDALLKQRKADSFPILLAHHPHAFDLASQAGVPLTLAGHTHGGQLMLTKNIGFGPQMFRYWSGLYERNDSALVVSNGVGNWFPLRINAPAEIIHITLRAKTAKTRATATQASANWA